MTDQPNPAKGQNTQQQPPPGRKFNFQRDVLRGVSDVKKGGKRHKLRVTVYPRGGGDPWVVVVEPREGGVFTLPDSGLSYHITPGSVRREDGKYKAMIVEGNPATINAHNIQGDTSMTPEAFNGFVENNLWMQYGAEVKDRSGWQTAGALGLGFALVAIIAMMIWMIVSIGGDLEGIRDAIQNMPSSSGGDPATPAEEAGHQPIAPGGR